MASKNKILAMAPAAEKKPLSSGSASTSSTMPKAARRLTTLRVGTITIDGKKELCLIRNISSGGAKAHVFSPVVPGQKVVVELKSDHPTSGTISWVKEENVGIAFDQAIDVENLLTAQADLEKGWQPRMPRVELDQLGELRIGARIYPINTCNVSQGGVRIEIDHPIKVGEHVVLNLEKWRPIEGVVRWHDQGQGGVSFNQVIPFQELMNWLR